MYAAKRSYEPSGAEQLIATWLLLPSFPWQRESRFKSSAINLDFRVRGLTNSRVTFIYRLPVNAA